MNLRLATPADAEALADLGRRSFIDKFGHLYSPENLASFLDEQHTTAVVAAQIANPGMRVAVIEDAGGRLAAYCKLVLESGLPKGHSPAQRPLELKQLYTDPAALSRGLGSRLMAWAIEQAQAHGADEVQLSVYALNPDAHRFYHRNGFAKIADIEFWVGDHCDPEFLYARPL